MGPWICKFNYFYIIDITIIYIIEHMRSGGGQALSLMERRIVVGKEEAYHMQDLVLGLINSAVLQNIQTHHG